MGERKICLKIAFDGTDFLGWQVQETGRTVQGVIEQALEEMHGRAVRIIGAGRTDSGVHARAQHAHFTTEISSIPAERFVQALNGLLPSDVRIRASWEVPPDFHARFDAVLREYRYRITYGVTDPLQGRYSLKVHYLPDLRLLNGYARCIIGTHDFLAFAAAGDSSDSSIRCMHGAVWVPEGEEIVLRVWGNAFLWKMVRSLAGTMLELEREKAPASEMKSILESCERKQARITAPARGLHLWRIDYA